MKSRRAPILILTLYSGENEIDACVEAVKRQTYEDWEHVFIRNLPNVEAHQKLYNTIMDSADKYRLFVKLDADMVFLKENALQQIVDAFDADPEMDHAVYSVRDWYSNTEIMGMSVYSSRVRWKYREEKIFVDTTPELVGIRKLFWGDPVPIADHSPNPSLKEAFLFGFHRATKVVQRDRWIKKEAQAQFQLHLLHSVWRQFAEEGDVRRAAAVYGAERVLSGRSRYLTAKADALCEPELEIIQRLGESGLRRLLHSHWSEGTFRRRWRTLRFVDAPQFANALLGSVASTRRLLRSRTREKVSTTGNVR